MPLPPYSPELVERIWLYVKERFHPSGCAWKRLTAEAGRIKSLCTYPWIPKVKT